MFSNQQNHTKIIIEFGCIRLNSVESVEVLPFSGDEWRLHACNNNSDNRRHTSVKNTTIIYYPIANMMRSLIVLLCLHAVWSRDYTDGARYGSFRSVEAHHLNMVYGAERIESHFVTHDELHRAVQEAQQSQPRYSDVARRRSLSLSDVLLSDEGDNAKDGDNVTTHLTCVLYNDGPRARKTLLTTFGEGQVSTVHVSQSDNRACFIVSTSMKSLHQLMKTSSNGAGPSETTYGGGPDIRTFRSLDFV